MSTIELNPEFLTKDGRREFAVLPYEKYLELEEWLQDAGDLLEIREARNDVPEEPNVALDEIEKEFGLR